MLRGPPKRGKKNQLRLLSSEVALLVYKSAHRKGVRNSGNRTRKGSITVAPGLGLSGAKSLRHHRGLF